MEARVDPLATFYRQQPARGPSAGPESAERPGAGGARPAGADLDSSDDELPVDDGRTPGRKAGWTDGLTDEERADRDFYDPKADDDDERWVVENLKHAAITAASSPGQPAAEAASSEPGIGTGGAGPGGAGPGGAGAGGAGAGEATEGADGAGGKRAGRKVGGVQLPPSDAVLSCPACFTLICLDCQRHSNFGNQWRALFAQNVTVLTEQRLTVGAGGPGEWYCKVQCEYCEAEVGVRDQDEVFHFFDVFPS